MDTTTENIIAMAAALPCLYGIVCSIRRAFNARKVARWVRENHEQEWNSLHWIAKRSPRAGVEVLITRGSISGPEVEEYRKRDEYLEKATWIGLFMSGILLFVILLLQIVASTFG
jgi:hypothetical protein